MLDAADTCNMRAAFSTVESTGYECMRDIVKQGCAILPFIGQGLPASTSWRRAKPTGTKRLGLKIEPQESA